MKKDSKQRLFEVMGRLDSTFKPKLNENRTHDYIRSAKTLEELEEIISELGISKGDLMKIAYDGNTRNVDSALPAGIWNALEQYGGTYWFVMDYNDSGVGGELVHLGEKILGIKTDWNEKIRDSMSDMNENNWYGDSTSYSEYIDELKHFVSLLDNLKFSEAKSMLKKFNEEGKIGGLKQYLTESGEFEAQAWVTDNLKDITSNNDSDGWDEKMDTFKGYFNENFNDQFSMNEISDDEGMETPDMDMDSSGEHSSGSSNKTPINKFVYFGYNYHPGFIQDVWADNPGMAKHLQSKFSLYYDRVGSDAVMNKFYVELDGNNQKILEDWIINNYRG